VTKRFLIAFAAQTMLLDIKTSTGCAISREKGARNQLTVPSYREPGALLFYRHVYAYLPLYMLMKRTALFLKEQQLEKLQTLSEKTGAPVAELIRRAIDSYLAARKKELK
jgi:hypothetical protein